LLKTVKGFCCLMQEIKNGIDRTHLIIPVMERTRKMRRMPVLNCT